MKIDRAGNLYITGPGGEWVDPLARGQASWRTRAASQPQPRLGR
jgi:hypothetical protein